MKVPEIMPKIYGDVATTLQELDPYYQSSHLAKSISHQKPLMIFNSAFQQTERFGTTVLSLRVETRTICEKPD